MQRRILCVDDESNLLKLYQQELRSEGYDVLSATSGEAALKEIDSTEVDLVLLDIKMKGQDGLETLARIRENHPSLPVVLHSAYTTYKSNFQSWLADDYLVKSSDLSQLKLRIRELLDANA